MNVVVTVYLPNGQLLVDVPVTHPDVVQYLLDAPPLPTLESERVAA